MKNKIIFVPVQNMNKSAPVFKRIKKQPANQTRERRTYDSYYSDRITDSREIKSWFVTR